MATTMTASPLLRTATDFPTDYWNDSCNEAELRYAIENGAVGATTNPTIVGTVMQQEYATWAPRVRQVAAEHPDWTDQQVTWQIIEEMAIRGWAMLEPIYQQHHGQKGRLSIQTDPTFNRSAEKMLEQARHFDTPGAQRADQVPGHGGRARSHRAGDLRGPEHQRHGVLHRIAGPGRRGRRRPSPGAA